MEQVLIDQFVRQATGNRRKAIAALDESPGYAPTAQVYATLYLADMIAAVFASLKEAA